MKSQGLTLKVHPKLPRLRTGRETGILGVAVKCVEISQNTGGEGESLDIS